MTGIPVTSKPVLLMSIAKCAWALKQKF